MRARHRLQLRHGLRLRQHAAKHGEEVAVAVDVGGADDEGVDVGAAAVNAETVRTEGNQKGGGLLSHAVGKPSLSGDALHPPVDDGLEIAQHLLADRQLIGGLVQAGLTEKIL